MSPPTPFDFKKQAKAYFKGKIGYGELAMKIAWYFSWVGVEG